MLGFAPRRSHSTSTPFREEWSMFIRVSLVLATALLVVLTGLPADAQDTKPKGVSATNLVTSLGGFRETVSSPIVLTGSLVTLEPGGQTRSEEHTSELQSHSFISY